VITPARRSRALGTVDVTTGPGRGPGSVHCCETDHSEARRDEVARQFIELIGRFAPDFEDCLEAYEVLGPRYRGEGGADRRPHFQGEVRPSQMWEHQLTPRTDVPGVYLCGAATHPAGSIIALNGRNAAMAVSDDLSATARQG
jgi:phytoene dehydrogenase-like protein